jgi:predicted amidohydrolase
MPARRIALAQLRAGLGTVEENLARMLEVLADAAARGADLVAFPELCLSGYVLDAAAYDAGLLAAVADAEAVLARAARAAGVAVVYGTPRRGADGIANAVVHVAADGAQTAYAKTHMDAREREVFAPGDAYAVVGDDRVGLACCYDLAFPEPARALALAGARLLCVPMAWEVARSFVLERVAAARAVENLAYLVCVNQCGSVGPFRFHGGSRVVDPLGETVAMLGDEAALAVVDVDLGLVDRLRDRTDERSYPLFQDRRADLAPAPARP